MGIVAAWSEASRNEFGLRPLLGVGKPQEWQGLTQQVLEVLLLRLFDFVTQRSVLFWMWHNFYPVLLIARR